MKNRREYIFIMGLLFLTQDAVAEKNEPTISNSSNSTITNTININLAISQETITSISIAMHQIQAHIQHYYNALASAAATPLTALRDTFIWMQEHKIATTGCACVSAWLYSHYFLAKLKYRLSDTSHWSLWSPTSNPEELFALPIIQVGEKLSREVQVRYTSAENPADVVGPITRFMYTVESEKELLTTYSDICTLLTHWGLQKIIWSDFGFAQQCAQRLTRLNYIKNVFSLWVTEYKLAHSRLS